MDQQEIRRLEREDADKMLKQRLEKQQVFTPDPSHPSYKEGFAEGTKLAEDAQTLSPIMRFFEYRHLPADLRVISMKVYDLAIYMDRSMPHGPEKTTGLRKLLEAKDCFVRASLEK